MSTLLLDFLDSVFETVCYTNGVRFVYVIVVIVKAHLTELSHFFVHKYTLIYSF